MAAKTRTPAEERRYMLEQLRAAMERCAACCGEAMWTNGYRVAKGKPEESRLFAKEMRQWDAVGAEQAKFRRLAQRLLREAARDR